MLIPGLLSALRVTPVRPRLLPTMDPIWQSHQHFNEDLKGSWPHLLLTQSWAWVFMCSKQVSGFRKMSAAEALRWQAGRTQGAGLAGIHMKRPGRFNWGKAQADPKVWARKTWLLIPHERNSESGKRRVTAFWPLCAHADGLVQLLSRGVSGGKQSGQTAVVCSIWTWQCRRHWGERRNMAICKDL